MTKSIGHGVKSGANGKSYTGDWKDDKSMATVFTSMQVATATLVTGKMTNSLRSTRFYSK